MGLCGAIQGDVSNHRVNMGPVLNDWTYRGGDNLPCIRRLSIIHGNIFGYCLVTRCVILSSELTDDSLSTGALLPGIVVYLTYFYPRRMIQTR